MVKPPVSYQMFKPDVGVPAAFYWECHSDSKEGSLDYAIPSAYVQIVIPIDSTLKLSGVPGEIDSPFIAPFIKQKQEVEFYPYARIFGIHLRVDVVHALYRVPLHHVKRHANNLLTVSDPLLVRHLLNLIDDSKSFEERVNRVDQFLKQELLGRVKHTPELLQVAVNLMHDERQIKIEEVAKEISRSERWLQMQFKKFIGISPKELQKLIRFNHFMRVVNKRKNGDTLTDAAYSCGYFDQSHCITEFQEYTGWTPKQFLNAEYQLNRVVNLI